MENVNKRNVLMSVQEPAQPGVFQEYPKAVYHKDGKTNTVVASDEELADLSPAEWRDSPAAFENHADHENYKARKAAKPSLRDLLEMKANLDAREAALNAKK
jgi:hypothetical protein